MEFISSERCKKERQTLSEPAVYTLTY